MFNKKQQSQNIYRLEAIFVLLLFFCLILGARTVSAQNPTSTNFQIENPTIVVGGGESTSSNFKLINSLGEFVIGESSSLNFFDRAGFLYFFDDADVSPATPSDSGGGGGSLPVDYPLSPTPGEDCKYSDFNCDGLVNIADLSIFLFHMEKGGRVNSLYDLSEDGILDIKDISIMFYYWDL